MKIRNIQSSSAKSKRDAEIILEPGIFVTLFKRLMPEFHIRPIRLNYQIWNKSINDGVNIGFHEYQLQCED